MNLRRSLPSLSVGLVAFGLVAVAVTVGLGPWVPFSLFVGLPTGLSAGLTAAFAVYAASRRTAAGDAVPGSTVRLYRAARAVVVAFVAVTAVGVAAFFAVAGALVSVCWSSASRWPSSPQRSSATSPRVPARGTAAALARRPAESRSLRSLAVPETRSPLSSQTPTTA